MKTETPEHPSLSALVLAGGESRRMGRDKAWVQFEGHPLVYWAVEKVRRLGVAEIYISGRPGNDYSNLECPVLFDLKPGAGPLGGVERGLDACTSPLLLVLAVDLPRMTVEFLQRLAARVDRLTGVVPSIKGRWEPLVAIYPKRCHTLAWDALVQSRLTMREFVHACLRERAVRALAVSAPQVRCFANWNTPEDTQGPLP